MDEDVENWRDREESLEDAVLEAAIEVARVKIESLSIRVDVTPRRGRGA